MSGGILYTVHHRTVCSMAGIDKYFIITPTWSAPDVGECGSAGSGHV